MNYYISSCVFTKQFPELSHRIREYVEAHYHFQTVRCCVPDWKVQTYEDAMPEGALREEWKRTPQSAVFMPGDEVWSLCANCVNIVEEWRGARAHSLWERIADDAAFPFPDFSGMKVTIQDCWRMRDRPETQNAVRRLLDRMHIDWVEAEKHHEDTDFCGKSLYRPQVERNPKLAPRHYREGAEGLFLPHSEEEQNAIMRAYCEAYKTQTVVCYCHYCLEGLKAGGVDGRHIAELLFGSTKSGR